MGLSPLRSALLAATLCAALGSAAAAGASGLACDQAGAQAEAAMQLPAGLLRAIGRVESGRRDPATGRFVPWPWTINANGQGRFFDDAAGAAAAVRALQAAGTASIDVGCFQVNLMHHPAAFAKLEDGFDPAANAAYAAAFLRALRLKLGSWEAAVGAYHSATAERGEAYRARVFATWTGAAPGSVAAAPLPAPRPAGPVVIRIAGPDLAGPQAPMRVWTPSRPGTAAALVAMPGHPRPAIAMPIETAQAGAAPEVARPEASASEATAPAAADVPAGEANAPARVASAAPASSVQETVPVPEAAVAVAAQETEATEIENP